EFQLRHLNLLKSIWRNLFPNQIRSLYSICMNLNVLERKVSREACGGRAERRRSPVPIGTGAAANPGAGRPRHGKPLRRKILLAGGTPKKKTSTDNEKI